MSFISKLLDRLFPVWRFSRRLREDGAREMYRDYLYYCGATDKKVNEWESFDDWLSCRGADPKRDYRKSRYDEYRKSRGFNKPSSRLLRFTPLYFDFVTHLERENPTESARSRMEAGMADLHARLDKTGDYAEDEED